MRIGLFLQRGQVKGVQVEYQWEDFHHWVKLVKQMRDDIIAMDRSKVGHNHARMLMMQLAVWERMCERLEKKLIGLKQHKLKFRYKHDEALVILLWLNAEWMQGLADANPYLFALAERTKQTLSPNYE